MPEYSLRDFCPRTSEHFDQRDAAEAALAEAEREAAAAAAVRDYWRGIAADPAQAAAKGEDPDRVPEQLRKAEEVAFSAEVRMNTRKLEVDAAWNALRECAGAAAEAIGSDARERLKEIQGRFDAAKAEMQAAATEEVELIQSVNDALTEVFGYDRRASDFGLTLRAAIG